MSDFITTIDSDDDLPGPSVPRSKNRKPTARAPAVELAEEVDLLDPDFAFDVDAGNNAFVDGAEWGKDLVEGGDGKGTALSVDDIIARRTGKPVQSYQDRKRKRAEMSDEGSDDSNDEDNEGSDSDSEDELDGEVDEDIEMRDEDDESGEEDGFGMGVGSDEEGDSDVEMGEGGSDDEGLLGEDTDDDEAEAEQESAAEESDSDEEEDTAAEKARKDAFFSTDPTMEATSGPSGDVKSSTTGPSFAQMSLSRPLLRALTSLNLATPTPIQSKAIPLALLGRDILGSAVTGSGKTMAFMIPILERLCYRDRGKGKGGMACRVLVLCPTRELAVQCEAVGKSLVDKGGMDIRFALLVGGLSLSAQAHTLRTLPDVLIATPGRLIDHLNNSPSFTLSALDILVIDEADRMLEVGFEAELNEIIKACPRTRQTMLFSATMTDSVDELVKLSLDRPVRVFVDPKRSTAKNLIQEFVRVRERGAVTGGTGVKGEDRVRAACLLALCKRTVKERCIIFFRSKALAHQMRIVFGLCGMKAAELHGNLTQEQRLQALQEFKTGGVDYLLATDLASRGLDIKGVETVINYDMPGQLSQYTHRVGRTARAGRNGRSITLVGEADRKMLKAAIKQSQADQVRHRVIPPEAISKTAEQLENLRIEVQEVLKEEKEEKMIRQAEMEAKKGQNMIEHEAEIFARPARTWFQSDKEKRKAQDAGKAAYVNGFPSSDKTKLKSGAVDSARAQPKRGKYEGLSRKQTRAKLAKEAEEERGDGRALAASIRAAKKAGKPVKITERLKQPESKKRKTDKGGKKKRVTGGTMFGAEKAGREGARAGRSDGVGLGGKKSGGGKSKGKVGGKGKGRK